ncbi:uncharacterized protein btla isoform X2 [Sphaeramia orbicularis]|uniref:uncharacterized protein btla isoform X2 n=1 Tax=Sphaeramia orbicularis TaxID=375764 RepID=UPI00117E6742|nr:uncharacterized protein LOC115416608 isoform X2 [Sphaeramia orbicularis]
MWTMTAEGLRTPFRTPFRTPLRCWTGLCVWVWAVLVLVSNGDGAVADPKCQTEIKVRRHTVYEASVGQKLRINCTVEFCEGPPPPVYWYKLENSEVLVNVSRIRHLETEWRMEKHLGGVSLLVFGGVLSSDSGIYQCESGNALSHYINVSISGSAAARPNVTSQTDRNWSTLQPYMYCAAGIMGMVVMVIAVSVLSMRGCKGKAQAECQTEAQYMVIPMVETPYPPPRPSALHPPVWPTPQDEDPAPPAQRHDDHVYGKVENDRERRQRGGTTEEGAGSVVYAALNHQAGAGAGPGAGPRPRRAAEETSEYASIRVS